MHINCYINVLLVTLVAGLVVANSDIIRKIKLYMERGDGGRTITKYLPHGKTFIEKDGERYECENGTISDDNGGCSGVLSLFKVKTKSDFCYLGFFIQAGNVLCVANTGFSVHSNNTNVFCSSKDDIPILTTDIEKYNKLCEDKATKIQYTYFANEIDPKHIEIPNENTHEICNKSQKGVCQYTENNILPFVNSDNRTYVVYESIQL